MINMGRPKKVKEKPVVDEAFTLGGLADEGDDDFTVGTIAGLDDESVTPNTTEESAESMVVVEENVTATSEVKVEENSVVLFTKSEALANIIADKNEQVTISNDGTTYTVTGRYLRVTRSMAEIAFDKEISNTQWRMLFLKREGFNISLSDHEFVMGQPSVDESQERKETIQTNIRMEIGLRDEMNKFRGLLGLSQNDYVIYAIKELNAKMEEELASLI